ncbi:MAG: Protein often found in Actinomycetes clustered with signal peptidase and/or RNaseHII, partial [uncultured Frankineae bacterium]
ERRGAREVRDRDGAAALPGVPRHRPAVRLRGRDRAPLLPGQLGGRAAAHLRGRGLVRADAHRRLGVGHVPPGALREVGAGADLQGRQRREAREARPRAAGWASSVPGV